MTAWIGPAIVAAFISATITGLGWFVARRHELLRILALRQERVKDVQTAVLADIRAYLHRLEAFDLQDYAAAMIARMEAAERDGSTFTPFIPAEVPSFIFEALVKDIQLLPTHIIDPVVLYYTQLKAVASIAEGMRSERFERLEISRHVAIYSDYVGLLIHARELGKDVVVILMASLGASLSSRA